MEQDSRLFFSLDQVSVSAVESIFAMITSLDLRELADRSLSVDALHG